MVFSSLLFINYFLPCFLIAYFLTPKKYRNYTFLAFSIFFYSWGGPLFIFLLIGISLLNFKFVKWISRDAFPKNRKLFLILSLVLNLGILVYFKYANFIVENLQEFQNLLGLEKIHWNTIVLPIGISFFTFQSITYTMDVYRNVHKPLSKFSDYLLYILSFPQMIAGPIVQFNSIADEITKRKENINEFLDGFLRFAIGLGKKILIANVLAETADEILDNYIVQDSLTIWLGMLCYAFQIYFDFSGYSDMAVGLGKMVGFHFPENFNNPYTANSITEFWRRWHITLGEWMKNYLYIPLGGNRTGKVSINLLNLGIVFVLSGLWHGASWNFVLWGCFHGFFLILDKLFLLNFLKRIGTFPATFFTFFLVLIAWVLFRMNTFTEAIGVYKKLFTFDNSISFTVDNSVFYTLIVAAIFSFFILLPYGKKIQAYFYETGNTVSIAKQSVLFVLTLLLLVLSMLYLSPGGMNPFIYYRF